MPIVKLKRRKRKGQEAQREIYKALKEIIENAHYYDFERNDGETKHSGIKGIDTYYSAVKLGNKVYSVKLTLNAEEHSELDIYKGHKIKEVDLYVSQNIEELDSKHSAHENKSTSFISLGKLTQNVKPNTSAVVEFYNGMRIAHRQTEWQTDYNPSKDNNGVRYSDKDEYQQFYGDLTGNSRLSLNNKQKSENKNSSGSMPTFESVERKSLESETFNGQDVTAARGTKNKVSLSENDVNLFKSKLSSVSVKLHSNRFLDAIKQALGFSFTMV